MMSKDLIWISQGVKMDNEHFNAVLQKFISPKLCVRKIYVSLKAVHLKLFCQLSSPFGELIVKCPAKVDTKRGPKIKIHSFVCSSCCLSDFFLQSSDLRFSTNRHKYWAKPMNSFVVLLAKYLNLSRQRWNMVENWN